MSLLYRCWTGGGRLERGWRAENKSLVDELAVGGGDIESITASRFTLVLRARHRLCSLGAASGLLESLK
ncbi:unnamed protein product [Leptidea sinapis]|uniref:Uncharacterized protein n=1 Tax=Leptidea sinapis TaxID=189913 RepID=A0A5E4R5J9_9NEOP|nr:unnamed protein product [Leptidea sinapis]